MRIGVLGGTFDPPHLGHLQFARAAVETLGLDEVIFVPAHRNPLKRAGGTPARARLEMVCRMIGSEPNMAASDAEISRGGASYTVETLMELQMVKPGEYWLLLGADALRGFERWRSPDKILRLARLGVALRPPMTESELKSRLSPEVRERLDIVAMKPVHISATELRDRLSSGKGVVAPFLTPGVLQYIEQHRLYRT